eukprot:24106-Chlamydomonas_euryale.AAC.6
MHACPVCTATVTFTFLASIASNPLPPNHNDCKEQHQAGLDLGQDHSSASGCTQERTAQHKPVRVWTVTVSVTVSVTVTVTVTVTITATGMHTHMHTSVHVLVNAHRGQQRKWQHSTSAVRFMHEL